MTDDILKKFDEAEKKYNEARITLRKAKDNYELIKAKVRTIIRTELTARNIKSTIQEIDDKVTLQQGNPSTELGNAFIEYATALAKREVLYQEKKSWERRYWDAKEV